MSEITVVELKPGSPLERGRAYGEQAGGLIRQVKATYEQTFGHLTGQTWAQLRERGGTFLEPARKFAPDLVEEIRGIAQGAGLSFEDVFLLNARSEIMFSPEALARQSPGECTAILVLPPATAGQGAYLAQNWDWLEGVRDCQVLLKLPGEGRRPPLASITEAGQVAKLGLNGAGVGLVVNNLNTDRPKVGVPWILICRKVLEADSLTKAMGVVLSTPRAHSINFLLGRAWQGEAQGFSLETCPTEPHILRPRDGMLVHTNHFLEPLTTARDLKAWTHLFPCTYNRHQRASGLLAGMAGRIDPDGIREILSDHFDLPHSVCMHQNPESDPAWTTQTCFSVIWDLQAKALEYCLGNPCQGEWRGLDLADFLSS